MRNYDPSTPPVRRLGYRWMLPVWTVLILLLTKLAFTIIDLFQNPTVDRGDVAMVLLAFIGILTVTIIVMYTYIVSASLHYNLTPVPGLIKAQGIVLAASNDIVAGNFNCVMQPYLAAARTYPSYNSFMHAQLLIIPDGSSRTRVIQIPWSHMLYIADNNITHYDPVMVAAALTPADKFPLS